MTIQTPENRLKVVAPSGHGWIEGVLNEKQMQYVWNCIKNKKDSMKEYLAGQISNSYELEDETGWFFLNVMSKYIEAYSKKFNTKSLLPHIGSGNNKAVEFNLKLADWWVNFQRQGEYNPIHNHSGVFSFVLWMKIPTSHDEQNKLPNSTGIARGYNSTFIFRYLNCLGQNVETVYKLNPSNEGTLLFFPSALDHAVYPFYDSSEERISVSGNIFLDV